MTAEAISKAYQRTAPKGRLEPPTLPTRPVFEAMAEAAVETVYPHIAAQLQFGADAADERRRTSAELVSVAARLLHLPIGDDCRACRDTDERAKELSQRLMRLKDARRGRGQRTPTDT